MPGIVYDKLELKIEKNKESDIDIPPQHNLADKLVQRHGDGTHAF